MSSTLRFILFALAYWAGAELSYLLLLKTDNLVAFWPPAGLYLAMLLATPQRRWWAVMLAASVPNFFSDAVIHHLTLPVSLGLLLVNLGAPLVGAVFVVRLCRPSFSFAHLPHVLRWSAIVSLVSTPLGALGGAALFMSANGEAFGRKMLFWWLGDLLGVLLVTPLAYGVLTERLWPRRAQVVEAAALLLSLGAATALVFRAPGNLALPSAVLFFFLLWAALRFSATTVAAAATVLAVIAIWMTEAGFGPFSFQGTPPARLLMAQLLVITGALLFYILAAAMAERRAAESALRNVNIDLEQKVQARTAKLAATNEQLLDSAERLRVATDAAEMYAWELDVNAQTIKYADNHVRVLGFALPADFAAMQEIIHPDDRVEILATIENARSTGKDFETECRLVNPSTGAIVWICTNGVILKDGAGNPLRVFGIVQNITRRKLAEETIHVNEERLSLLHSIVANPNLNDTARLQSLLELGCQQFGLENGIVGEITGDVYRVALAVSPDDAIKIGFVCPVGDAFCEEVLKRDDLLAIENVSGSEWREHRAHSVFGTEVYFGVPINVGGSIFGTLCFTSATPRINKFTNGDHEFLRLLAQTVGTEMTRQHFTEKLHENQQFTNSIIETAPTVLYTFNLKTGGATYLTDQAATVLGYSLDEVKDTQADFLAHHMHPDDAKLAQKHFQKISQTSNGEVFEFEYRMRHKSGEWRWFRSRDRIFKRDENGTAEEILGIALDITERKQAADLLRESEARLHLGIEIADFAICEIDYATDTNHLTKEAARLFGLGNKAMSVPRERVHATFHPDDREKIAALIKQSLNPKGDGRFALEHRIIHKNGDVRWLNVRKQIYFDHSANPPRPLSGILAAQEITERKQAEEELRASEEFSRTVLESSPDCVKIIDAAGRLQFMNASGLCLLEIDDFDSYRDKLWGDLWTEETQPVVKEAVAKALQGETASFQAFCPTTKGTPKWWDVIVSPIADADGKPSRIISVSRDITESKRREKNLVFLAEISKDFAPLSSVAEILEIAGKRIAEHLGLSHYLFVEIDEAAHTAEVIYDQHATGTVNLAGLYSIDEFHTVEEWRELSAGNAVVINNVRDESRSAAAAQSFEDLDIRALTITPFVSNGRWKFSLSALHSQPHQWQPHEVELMRELAERIYDRLERARAEEKLRESEERFRAVFDSIDEGFCIVEMIFDENDKPLDYIVSQANPAFSHLTGLPPEALGKSIRELVPDLEEFWFETYGKVALTGKSERFENFAAPMNRWFDVYASRIGSETSRRVAIVFNNITERKQSEAEREQLLAQEQEARAIAEAATRAKDEFIAVVSHELRNPLSTILGYNRLLRQSSLLDEATQQKYNNIIESSARRQLTLIEDLLDTARMVSGKLKLDIRPLNFARIISDTLDAARPTAEAKQITLAADLDEPLDGEAEITGDPDRLQQVVWNLLTNAIKFTPERGAVIVRLAHESGQLRLTVTDTGKGLSPELLPHVFDRFHQADSSSTRRHGGLGLGLALVKQLVEMHGGTIAASSPGEGQGATFTITLPRHASSAQPGETTASPEAPTPSALLTGLRILVVEDEADAREIVMAILTANGAHVTPVASSSAALAVLINTTAHAPHVLVSDIGMPDVDGYELMRQVRQQGFNLPAIAVTAFGRMEDRLRALTAGFQMHVPKPIEPDELIAVILSLTKR